MSHIIIFSTHPKLNQNQQLIFTQVLPGNNVNIKQSHYRPEQALRVPGV
jgi:hypothetical protein